MTLDEKLAVLNFRADNNTCDGECEDSEGIRCINCQAVEMLNYISEVIGVVSESNTN